ncbi:MAG: 2-oxo acid dehydrogenase subunit E2 [Betaproteobacteria bacterium]|nr:2-oxo acid dehydrogenase subunit E2 [Betaproteobacteria bacterium]
MIEFTMPSLGADMEEGTFVEWHVKPGDTVARGDVVCVVETQKGAVDVEIWEAGTVVELVAQPGQKIPVGGVMAYLSAPGEKVQAPPVGVHVREESGGREPAPRPPSDAGASAVAISAGAAQRTTRARVSPAARKRASELSVDLAGLTGTGPQGAVTLADVENATARQASRAPEKKASSADAMRAAIAAAMAKSKREIPHYYLGAEIRVDRAMEWLTKRNEPRPVTERVLFAALQLKAVAAALCESPRLNGHFVDGTFRPSGAIHLGVAISMRGGGLVAPAIHDTGTLPLDDLMRHLRDLVQRARQGQLRSSELTDATITVTSLGDLGVSTVYGVIYPPQVALVGFGRPLERPWVEDGRVVVARTIQATLSADHRVTDGMTGAGFLAALDRQFQEPESLA